MRRIAIVSFALVVIAGTAIAAAGANEEPGSSGQVFIRWDLPQLVGGTILAGGTDVSTDAPTGDTITLTGSGHAEPGEGEAAGGGTFTHRDSEGTVKAEGIYRVVGFIGWRRISGGSFEGTGVVDAIGNGTGAVPDEGEETSGVLRMNVLFVPVVDGEPQQGIEGILKVQCHLPGSTEEVEEGVVVRVPSFDLKFTPTSGVTLFHRLV